MAEPSISGSLRELAAAVSDMLRLNFSMLYVEMSQKATLILRAAIALALAFAIILFAISYSIFAAYHWLIALAFSPMAASWIVAGICLLISGALALYGIGAISKLSPVPKRTIAEFSKNFAFVKSNLKSGATSDDAR
jgi:uncharacterized membrane protein YqjE